MASKPTITDHHQGNAIKTTINKIHHTHWDGYYKKKKRQKITVSEDVEKLEPLCTASGNRKWCSGSSENSIAGPQKIKHRMTLRSSNSSPRFIP